MKGYNDLVNAAGIWRSDWLTRVGVHDVQRLAPLLDMLNAGFLFTLPETIPIGFHEVPVYGRDRLKLGRRDSAWPRAFFVDGVAAYAEPSDLLRQAAAEGHPFAAIQTGDGQARDATRALPPPSGRVVRARDYRLTPNSTTFTVTADGPGVIVLDESYVPGDFIATINGREVPYFRVNHVFKAASIPAAGTWRVRFEYRPARWHESLMLASIGLIGCVVIGLRVRPQRSARGAA
jgi:hypothetical protein